MLEVNFSGLDALADEVVVHFDVFSPRVKYGVMREVDTTHVVAVQAYWIFDGYAQIF